MANQTASRRTTRGKARLETLALPPQYATGATTPYYAGGAVSLVQNGTGGTGAGTLGRTMDGSVDAIFAGLLQRDLTVPITASGTPESPLYDLPLGAWGSNRFDAVDSAGSSTTPTAVWVGKYVYFHTDHEVALTPPTGATKLYPIRAGIVVGISSTYVEVLMNPSIFGQLVPTWISVGQQSVASMAANTPVEFLLKAAAATANRYTFGRRVWIGQIRVTVQTTFGVSAGTDGLVLQFSKSNGAYANLTTTSLSLTSSTGVAGATLTGVLQAAFDPTDVLGLQWAGADATSDPNAGVFNTSLEVFRL